MQKRRFFYTDHPQPTRDILLWSRIVTSVIKQTKKKEVIFKVLEVDVLKLMDSKICQVDGFKIRMSMKLNFTLSQDTGV